MPVLRSVVALVVSFLIVLGAAACSRSALDAIKARGVLRVGLTGDYAPFSRRAADGSFHGADVEMARSLAATLGVQVELVPTAWGSMAEDLSRGRFDVAMGGVSVTPERAEKGYFSSPLLTDGKRPIVRCADKDRYISIAVIDQPAVRIIVNPGGTNERFARETFKSARVTVHPDNRTIFGEIAEGRADLMVTDGIEVDLQARRFPGVLCAAAVASPFTRFEKAYWMVPDPALKAAVDGWLDQAMRSGAWARALDAAQEGP